MKTNVTQKKLTSFVWMTALLIFAGHVLAEVITPGDYSNRIQIKFPGYTGATPLTNFPALIQLSEGRYNFNFTDLESDDYSDLRFTDDTGTNAIPFEVEQWKSTKTTPVTPTALSGCLLWLKADAGIQTNDVGGVTNWICQASGSNAVSMATNIHPAYVSNGFSGLPVVRFSGADDNYIKFPRLTTIRTVFWVIKEDSDASSTNPRFLLGDSSSNNKYYFHRGDNKMIWSSANASMMYNGITELNGVAIDGRTTLMPTSMSVLSVRAADTCTADSLSKDRTQTGRSWDGDVAEVIIYNRTLTSAEVAGIYAYLQAKYAIRISPTATLWVQVPVLTNNASIYAYWGNPAAIVIPEYATNGTLWADGYVGVYHLKELGSSLTFADSSPLRNTLTSAAATADSSGKSDQCLYLKPNISTEPPRISAPAGGLTLGNLTVSLWVNVASATSWRNWWGIEAGAGNHVRMELDDETPAGKCNIFQTGVSGANAIGSPSKPVEDGNWHHLVFTADAGANVAKVYVDGDQDGTSVAWSAVAAATGLKIGASWAGGYTNGIGGKIDEARFEKNVRSASWIKASYDNQMNPSAFAVVDLDYYYDKSTSAGLQAGSGLLSLTNALWSTEAAGSNPLIPWSNGGRVYFNASGTSTVTLEEPIQVKTLRFGGTGYTLSGGSIELAEGIVANETATINPPVTLNGTQTWNVATGKILYLKNSLSNVSNLTKTGGGTLYFDGREIALQGTLTIQEGTLFCRGGGWYETLWANLSPRTLIVSTNGILSHDTWGMGGTAYVNYPIPTITLNGGTWRLDGSAEVRADNVVMTAGRITGSGQWRVGGGAMVVNPDPATSVIDGSGSLTLYASPTFQVADGAADPDLSITRAIGINGTGRTLTKTGTGTLLMTGANTYDGGTTISAGTLLVNNTTGSGTGTGTVTINGGTLSGTGTVANAVSFGANGGTIVPGPTTGALTVKSNVTFTASGSATNRFKVTINSATDYTQLRVADGGTVTLGNATLNVTLNTELFNAKLFIIVNDGEDPIDGTFKDLPEGTVLSLGPNEDSYTIHYAANANTGELSGGNDVALVPVPKGTILLFH